jgi:DNA-binding NtrC family response regulator
MKKILIVEDEYDIGEIVEMTLGAKYEVLVKNDSRELTAVLKQFKPDAILLDNYIGNKDAQEIIDEIKSEGFDLAIPMILFSAHEEIKSIARDIGAIDFIAKPFDLEDLHRCMSRVFLSIQNKERTEK